VWPFLKNLRVIKNGKKITYCRWCVDVRQASQWRHLLLAAVRLGSVPEGSELMAEPRPDAREAAEVVHHRADRPEGADQERDAELPLVLRAWQTSAEEQLDQDAEADDPQHGAEPHLATSAHHADRQEHDDQPADGVGGVVIHADPPDAGLVIGAVAQVCLAGDQDDLHDHPRDDQEDRQRVLQPAKEPSQQFKHLLSRISPTSRLHQIRLYRWLDIL